MRPAPRRRLLPYLEILVIQPWTGTRERETERELRNRLLLPRVNTIRNDHNMPPFPGCLKPLFQSEVKCEAIDMKMIFTLMQIKLIFTREVLHLTWFWKWEFVKLCLCPVGFLKAALWRRGLKSEVVETSWKRHWGLIATSGERTWVGSERCPLSISPLILPLCLIIWVSGRHAATEDNAAQFPLSCSRRARGILAPEFV